MASHLKQKRKQKQKQQQQVVKHYERRTQPVNENFQNVLANLLKEYGYCSTLEESLHLVEGMMDVAVGIGDDDENLNDDSKMMDSVREEIQNYLLISKEEVDSLIEQCMKNQKFEADEISGDESDCGVDDDSNEDACHLMEDIEDDDDIMGKGMVDEENIGPGECFLCERYCKNLTRHHLIPKSTWPRLEMKLLQSSYNDLDDDGDTPSTSLMLNAGVIEGSARKEVSTRQKVKLEGFEDFTWTRPGTSQKKSRRTNKKDKSERFWLRLYLSHYTSDVCGPCHSMIHHTYDNMTLATSYNTEDKLLSSEILLRHGKWAHKQRIRGGNGTGIRKGHKNAARKR